LGEKIKINIFTCGLVGVDPAVPDRGISSNPIAYTGLFRSKKNRIYIPVKAVLIRHPKGNILVDAAWDSEVRRHPIRTITFPMWVASKPILPVGEAVDEQLERVGIAAADLDYVIMTHLDIDHDSGLRLVKDAKHIVASDEEIKAFHSSQTRYVKKPLKGIRVDEMPMKSDDWSPYKRSWDVFGDGSVTVIFMPGHAQGSVVVRVQGQEGFVLIVGDTGYNTKSWEELKIPGPVYDKEKMKRSLMWVQEQRNKAECLGVFAAHDPDERRAYMELEVKT